MTALLTSTLAAPERSTNLPYANVACVYKKVSELASEAQDSG